MTNKLYVSARIPEELHEKLESYAEAKGESKSSILIDALSKYLNPKDSNDKEELELGERVKYFEQWVFKRLADIDNRVRTLEELKHQLATIQQGNQVLPVNYQHNGEIKRLPPG